ncbi:MAG TPA: SDR family oxidoreductase [Chitinophagales bacterium]|nr:SDR family oxidoreductase [Chitinophagales bacterium]HMX05183.1 SDR family oxidoreductase [Chitinophagales bacterium]HMZ88741.1 SDR family oxidoreductase [Chitinophagales bacterium]HNA57859.1 SDR family oxidoreductase [Chitinophagales bacterium]HNE45596.1 SDR family oxidoreductase [Chitinophagales bacterium]
MNCIITGGTKGIGKACALLFAKNGFNVAICARDKAALNEMSAQLHDANPTGKHLAISCDVRDRAQLHSFGENCLKAYGSIDVLINNAGVFLPGNITEEAEGTLEFLIETNVYSAYHLTRQIVPVMRTAKKGYIFNICSVASINSYDGGGSYAISKFALLGFTKNLRHELKTDNIRVTAVLPGAVLTPSWDGTPLPESRFIPADDIATLILQAYQLSDRTVVEEILIRPQLGDL